MSLKKDLDITKIKPKNISKNDLKAIIKAKEKQLTQIVQK
jgi:hypothetical protein